MNQDGVAAEPFFESADSLPRPPIRDRRETGRTGSHALNFREVVALIGRNSNGAAVGERTLEGNQKISCEQPASGMTPLRPRIGKHQMKPGHGTGRQKMANSIGNFAAQDACVAQPVRGDFLAGTPDPSEETLNAEKISFRAGAGCRREKRAIAASEINLQRSPGAEGSLEIEWNEIIRRNNFRCECFGSRSSRVEHRLLE